jgi:hypothetical protein
MPMMKFSTLNFFINKYIKVNGCNKNDYYLFNEKEAKAPERCVENVLNFARSYRVAKSKSAGNVEMILN